MIYPGCRSILLEDQTGLWNEGTLFAPYTGIHSFVAARSWALQQFCKLTAAAPVPLPGTL